MEHRTARMNSVTLQITSEVKTLKMKAPLAQSGRNLCVPPEYSPVRNFKRIFFSASTAPSPAGAARAPTASPAGGSVQHYDHRNYVLPSPANKALVSKRCTSTRRHDSCSSGLLVPISVITTAMEIIRTSGVETAGQAVAPVLPAPHFFAQGGKQYGSVVVNYINRALAGRSAYVGLSFLWLWPLGHCWGAADCHHRNAPHWPNMKGAAIQSRGIPCHSTPTCTARLRYSPACSPWC
jgi:hypothetical protein